MTTEFPRAADSAPAPLLPIDYDHVRTIDADAGAQPRNPVAKLFAEYNPFYFLSACCMLLGCFVLNDALDWSPLPQDNLLVLIATLNVYEAALITLGIVLVRKRLLRDGTFLLVLEAIFLADAGFLNMEVFTTDVGLGLVVNVILFALAALKLGVVFAALGLRVRSGLYAFALVQLGVLLAMTGVFAEVASRDNGELSAFTVYGAWWALGLIPVLHAVLVRTEALSAVQLRVVQAFLVLPFVSLIAHLCLANWVYDVKFYPANLAPLLLGLTVLAGRYDRHVTTLAVRMRLQLALPVVAVAVSLRYPWELIVFPDGGISFSPLRLTLLGSAVVYVDGWWLHRHPYFLWAAATALGAAWVGPWVNALGRGASNFRTFLAEYADLLRPKTPTQWGVVSVSASFVLLAVGAGFSLLRGKRSRERLEMS